MPSKNRNSPSQNKNNWLLGSQKTLQMKVDNLLSEMGLTQEPCFSAPAGHQHFQIKSAECLSPGEASTLFMQQIEGILKEYAPREAVYFREPATVCTEYSPETKKTKYWVQAWFSLLTEKEQIHYDD
jgi:hypothetical protein